MLNQGHRGYFVIQRVLLDEMAFLISHNVSQSSSLHQQPVGAIPCMVDKCWPRGQTELDSHGEFVEDVEGHCKRLASNMRSFTIFIVNDLISSDQNVIYPALFVLSRTLVMRPLKIH